MKKLKNWLFPKLEPVSHDHKIKSEPQKVETKKATQIETEGFTLTLDPNWIRQLELDANRWVFEHKKLDAALVISQVPVANMPVEKIPEAADVLLNARLNGMQEAADLTGKNMNILENEIVETSWGRQVVLTNTNDVGGGMFFSGFVSRKFILQISVLSLIHI